MRKTIRSVQFPFLAMAAVGLAACGGGGGGGGGGSSLTQEQQVAVASSSAIGAVTAAATSAQATVEDTTAQASTAVSQADTPIRNAVDPTDCEADFDGSGQFIVYDAGDTTLDIFNEPFPAPPFSNDDQLPAGTESYLQVRADCSGSGLLFDGSLDLAVLDVGSGREAVVYRSGGRTGLQAADLPDTSSELVLDAAIDGFSIEFRSRGEFHSCLGCNDGNLADFSGNPELDLAFAAWLDMVIDTSRSPRLAYELGNSPSERLTLVTSEQGIGTGVAAADIDGRLAVQKQGSDCDFDVTYETVRSLIVENFAAGTGPITDGELNVTNNDTGDIFNVEYDSEGNVYVDGERVDIDEFDGLCEA